VSDIFLKEATIQDMWAEICRRDLDAIMAWIPKANDDNNHLKMRFRDANMSCLGMARMLERIIYERISEELVFLMKDSKEYDEEASE
jgi:hypothetical protein